MSVKTKKIVGRIAELGLTGEAVAKQLGINPATYYRKMSGGGEKFTIEQAQALAQILQMTNDEAASIFLGQ